MTINSVNAEEIQLSQEANIVSALDPRRTETAVAATQHHALAPKSDLELLYERGYRPVTTRGGEPHLLREERRRAILDAARRVLKD